ncbi:prolipoprotein diacylglyceryl transferase [Candidatus Tisiphia endosymbiont of Nemotelus uliginosus]|uniref:prolipoprotein diacylglyceryl transferase n=1 Tax=Candidatus Tisiphia endosymbiont of Nemotelus uliginosus TaxID=3077926 RepID=UPI0035C895AC
MIFPNVNPVAFYVGPFAVHWYSIAYVCGIIIGWFYAQKIINKFQINITSRSLENFVTWAILGIIVGGRLGYVLLYDPIKYFSEPIKILKTYEGGMSFHGGLLGLIIASYLFCYKYKIKFLLLADILAAIAPIGLFLGRIANFINGELYGRVTDMPWGVVFPASDLQLRHPSQLYEAILEGIILFLILFYSTFKYKTIKILGINSAIFLIFYSIFRIIIELFREPDLHIGFIYHNFTMGQILSFPMLILGIYLLVRVKW